MSEIPRQTLPLKLSIYTLKNEGQEGKTGTVQGWVPMGGGKA
jgi:hypothetical protein